MRILFLLFFVVENSAFDVLEFSSRPPGKCWAISGGISGATSGHQIYTILVIGFWSEWTPWEPCSVKRIHTAQQLYTSVRERTCECKNCTVYCRIVRSQGSRDK